MQLSTHGLNWFGCPSVANGILPAKVHAFNAGYARMRDLKYEVIGSLDGDISFDDQDYFSFPASETSGGSCPGSGRNTVQGELKSHLRLPLR